MQAIILASGVGSRLKPLTDDLPKCLVDIHGKSILERIVDSLIEHNIGDLVITTGFEEGKIRTFMEETFPNIHPQYIHNEKYNETNYIYSIWKTKDVIKGDVLTIHSDLVYEWDLLRRVMEMDKSGVLINREIPLPEKDFKARLQNGKVVEVGVNIFGEDAGFCIPIYKFLKKDWDIFMNEMDQFVRNNEVNCYAENAMNNITDAIHIHPVYYTSEFAMEIDDHEDLEKAKRYFIKQNS